MRYRLALGFVLLAVVAFGSAGCSAPYYPGGNFRSANTFTYLSTTYSPKTISVVDTRTGEEIWTVDLPVGQQLTMQFVEGKGDDPVYLPDLMRYRIGEKRFRFGSLKNAISVPDRTARRVVLKLRPTPEFPPEKK